MQQLNKKKKQDKLSIDTINNMTNFRVTLLKTRGDYQSKMVVNILAHNTSEARQKAKFMYPYSSIIAVVKG